MFSKCSESVQLYTVGVVHSGYKIAKIGQYLSYPQATDHITYSGRDFQYYFASLSSPLGFFIRFPIILFKMKLQRLPQRIRIVKEKKQIKFTNSSFGITKWLCTHATASWPPLKHWFELHGSTYMNVYLYMHSFSINVLNIFSLPYHFKNLFFTVRIQYLIHIIYKMC